MKNSTLVFALTFLLALSGHTAKATIVLPSFFSDNMVLQRNADVKFWGWGSPFEEVVVHTGWDNKEYKLKPNNQSYWEVTLKTPGAGGPYTINFKGENKVALNNVMLGEVWLCSGQSNMEWTPALGIDNAEAEIAKANYPNIRFFTAPKLASEHPQMNVPGHWEACTPQSMRNFSAVAYYFAQHLQEDLKGVPIGMINSSWAGSPAEPWIPKEYVAAHPVLSTAAAKVAPVSFTPTEPGRTFNAMIKPLVGYKIAGVLWYQGESNSTSAVYDKTLEGLIRAWRGEWKDDFPFYYVQIAPYNYGGDIYQGAVLRDAQRKVLQAVPQTGMVVVGDISPTDDIHPKNKKTVGQRLANLALTSRYNVNKGIVNGPLYKDFTIDKSKVTINFENAKGLHFKGKTSTQFEIAGEDGIFHPAEAKLIKETVVLSSKLVKNPLMVRYCWHNTAQPDLFNSAGLPASTFASR